jgi:transcriptional regulator of heat shock response
MRSRHASTILLSAISEHIASHSPVSSRRLGQRLKQRLSPATIRNVLRELEEEGYLLQPHTSAGRLPTDQGYRYYVDRLDWSSLPHLEQRHLRSEVLAHSEQKHFARACAQVLSHRAGTLAISVWLPEGDWQATGLDQILSQISEHAILREISDVLRFLEEHTPALATHITADAIYIGQENPFLPTQYTSLLIKRVPRGSGDALLILVGLKWMHYHRNLSLLNTLADLILTQQP